MAEAIIELRDVRKEFGEFVAVHRANFDIGRGEFFSLLGPSGCGKTTTLRMIAGFEHPTSGALFLDGRDVSSVPPFRRNVNTVFQHYALFPHMSVRQNIAYGPKSQKVDKAEIGKRVDDLLEIVQLGSFADRKPAQLSGGQQQRVALARALACYPSALLLDEPLGALDLKLRQDMQLELKRIQREVGITFIYVTHDQLEALTMSDRIAVMNAGHVEQIDSPTEIFDNPASVFVAGFIGDANLVPATVTHSSDAEADIEALGTTLSARCHHRVETGEATLVIRPSRIAVGYEAPTGPAVSTTITSAVFQGSTMRLAGEAANGNELYAFVARGALDHIPEPGETTWWSWARPDALVVPGRPPTDRPD